VASATACSGAGGRRGQRPVEQLGPLAHPGEPVAVAVAGSGPGAVRGVVLDGEPGPVALVAQAQLDPLGVGVLADVGERLLGRAVDGQAGLGAELASLPGDRQVAADAAVALELVGQPGQPLRPRQLLVVAQRADGAPRVPQPGLGQVVGALQGGGDPSGVRRLGGGQQPGALQLQGER
jgi:hypothetical protein